MYVEKKQELNVLVVMYHVIANNVILEVILVIGDGNYNDKKENKFFSNIIYKFIFNNVRYIFS